MRNRTSITACGCRRFTLRACFAAAFAWPIIAQQTEHAEHTAPVPVPVPQHSEHAEHGAATAAVPLAVTEEQLSAAFPDLGEMRMGDMMLENPLNKLVLLDRLEWHDAPGSPLTWDVDAWIGRDLAKLWIRTEGERRDDATEHAELEILWGKSFARWWDFVAGARYDAQPSPERGWAALGVRGTAPFRFDIEATSYVGESGDTALRFEARYDLLVTNRLVLQPELSLDAYGQSDASRGVGAGLAEGELGLRLRYELRREIAPYVGLVHVRSFGRTADFAQAAGAEMHDTRLVAGIRVWF